MTLNHFQVMLLFAIVISVGFAFLTKETTRERVKYAVWSFLMFLFVAIAVAWVMYPFSR